MASKSEASDIPGSPVSSRKGPLTPYFAPLTDFPRGKKAAEKRQIKKARQAAKRAKKREAQLIRQGRLPPKPSRSARAKAMRAKELAGGVTQYQLFTPMKLPMDLDCTTLSTLEATPDPQQGTSVVLKRTMRTQTWVQVRNQLYVMRNYLRQADVQGGDMGLAPEAAYPTLHRHHRHAAKAAVEKAHHRNKTAHEKDGKTSHHHRKTPVPEPVTKAPEEDELDLFDGDLALPPPALELPDDMEEHDLVGRGSDLRHASSSPKHSSPGGQQPSYMDYHHNLPADQEEETRTGRHLSDIPLSPNYTTAFGRDFGRTPRIFSQLRASGKKRAGKDSASAPLTSDPPSAGKEGSQNSTTKTPSDGDPSKATAATTAAEDEGAWWLHVHCPTYKDMHEISKLFPMHPLTVEDVLQQDPREKVDVFDRLGYYFVVIRAIDERYFRYTSTSIKGSPGSPSFTGSGSSSATVHGEAEAKTKNGEDNGQDTKSESLELRDLADKTATSPEDGHSNKHQDGGHNARLAAPARLGKGRVEIVEGIGGKEGLEGVSVGGNNLYLLVFSHGVISFAFEDVSKHIDRVAARLLEITRPVELTADWIAHDLYDSVVDAFFPLISFVQSEVVEVEDLASVPVSSSTSRKKKTSFAPKQRRQRALLGSNPQGRLISVEPVSAMSSPTVSEVEKRTPMLEVRRLKTIRALRPLPILPLGDGILNRLPDFLVKQKQKVTISRLPEWEFKDTLEAEMRRTAAEIDEASNSVFDTQAAADQSIMLHRIADTRKIVTGLSRLLGPKNDAVKGLRKRLADMQQLQRREEALIGGNSRSTLARTEVSMYMSDVHDHIISMLNQLNSGEGRLSEIHHTYLAQITIENRKFRQGADTAILTLASVATTVLIIVFITSIFSLNVARPGNELESDQHAWFGGIVFVAVCVPFVLWRYVKWLYKESKSRVARVKAAR
uniref:Uncharacterized protein n=1 Tax=Kalmanozyma brasiliensis (strain GHG001) TaxID=1365824 RepID=V5GV66_KALBG